jgi:F-type H+-transporting ATPase subunit delta
MTHSAVATRYANALADVVTTGAAGTNAEAIIAELRAFDDALRASLELQAVLTSPAVPPARKRAVVGKIGDILNISRITRNFLFVLIDHRRIMSLTEIIQSFETVSDERLGFARADVSSARELAEPQRKTLSLQLERLTGKRVRARYSVDDSLIGGVVARIGSTVYDGSVRGQLDSLGKRLSTES